MLTLESDLWGWGTVGEGGEFGEGGTGVVVVYGGGGNGSGAGRMVGVDRSARCGG